MQRATLFAAALIVAATSTAFAEDDRIKGQLQEIEQRCAPVAPGPGREKASPRVPPWCNSSVEQGGWEPGSIARGIEASRKDGWTGYFHVVPAICKYIQSPAAQKCAAVVEQEWINITGLSVAEAAETFGARMRKDEYAAAKQKLCDNFEVSEEVEGEEKTFTEARRAVFGCVKKGWADKLPLWADEANKIPDDLVYFMDASASGVDEILRLALIHDHARFIFNEHKSDYFDRQLVTYVFDQYDQKKLDRAAVLKTLEQAPYKDNMYARAVLLETLGTAQRAIAMIDAEVQKKAKDADWKELLVTAPQAGIAAYERAAAKYKAELQRSAEFEAKFWGVSKRAAKGCWPGLKKDFVGVVKAFKRGSAREFEEQLSDPIASVLMTRLAACASLDEDNNYAAKLNTLTADLRGARGPRLAAYYSAVDALSKIVADRPKFPVKVNDFWFFKNNALYSRTLALVNEKQQAVEFQMGDGGKGVVKTMKKGPNGVEITFQTESHQEMGSSCTPTNRILAIRSDGTLSYYQKCHDTGLFTVNDTAPGITIPSEWAGGITVGSAIEFFAKRGKPPTRIAMPKAAYKDKSKKMLTNFYGLAL